MIEENSSLRRFRNGGVTGKITRAVVQKKGNSNKFKV